MALVVGDVAGHGAAAAAAMAQLRTVLHEALLSGTPLTEAIDRLDRIVGTAGSEPSTALTTSLPERISDLAVERILGAECTDDVIVLAAHLLPGTLAPLILSATAKPEQLSGLREAVSTWVTELGADHDDRLALCLAAYEAVGSARPKPDGTPRTEPFSAVVTRHDPTVITARGTVDAGTVGLLSTEVAKYGAAPVVIDLALVTFLASAGVQLLHDLITQHDVRLHAPAGTPAHEVLNLVGLSDLLVT